MSSPAKRRKKNDFKASDKPVRSLDYFFAKQKDKSQLVPDTAKSPQNGTAEGQLTDEELARKLQEEWNRKDGIQEPLQQGSSDREQQAPDERSSAPKSVIEDEQLESNATAVTNTLRLQSTATAEDTIASNIPFDQNPLTFEPSKYVPDLKTHWAADGEHATYALLTRCFVLVNSTQSRIKIVDTLVNFLRTIIEGDPHSVLPAVRAPSPDNIHARLRFSRSGSPRTLFHRPMPISSWVWVDQPFRKPWSKYVD